MSETVESERLILRRWREQDLAPMAAINADPEVMRWIEGGQVMSERETADEISVLEERWAERGFGLFAVEDKDSGRLAGFAGLSIPKFLPELLPAVAVGSRFGRDFWGRGYATEALNSALWFGFEQCGMQRIVSTHQIANAAADRCALKLGMSRVKEIICPGCGAEMYVYEIFKEDFTWTGARVRES